MNLCLAHGGDVSQPSGGTDRVTAIAAGLEARGFDVSLVVPEPEGEFPDRLSDVDIEPVGTDLFGRQNAITRAAAVAGRARSVAEERDAILQLEHSSLAGVGTFRGCDGFVLDMHDIAYPRFDHVETPAAPLLKRGVKWLERRAVDRARHIVVVSEYMERMLREEWEIPGDRITVVPNGYFPDRIAGLEDVDEEPGRVCFLGTLHPKVDVDAFAAIADLPGVSEMIVIGDGAQRKRVEELAAEKPAVRATGRLPDEEAFELLASAAVVVNPQTHSDLQRSSSPVKLFYYAALGKPMVVSEGPSIVRQFVDADAARTATSRQQFVRGVEELIASESRRIEMKQNAGTLAADLDWTTRSEQIATLHERVAAPDTARIE